VLVFSAENFEQANVDTASPMQLIAMVMKRAAFPLVDAMSPFLSDSDSPHERGSRNAASR
jgi:flagellin-specific chaperone FliS